MCSETFTLEGNVKSPDQLTPLTRMLTPGNKLCNIQDGTEDFNNKPTQLDHNL